MNIIAFSLYGDDQRYQEGALRNIRLSREVYPGWVCRFYVSQEIPQECIDALKSAGAQVVQRERKHEIDGMFWRFLAAEDPDVDVCIVRDADARLTPREKSAVDEWLASGKAFHIMRDHPQHRRKIMGGMWGSRIQLPMTRLIKDWKHFGQFGDDQKFLAKHIYPRVRKDVLIHSNFWYFKGEKVLPFPSEREGMEWVGKPVSRPELEARRETAFARLSVNHSEPKIVHTGLRARVGNLARKVRNLLAS